MKLIAGAYCGLMTFISLASSHMLMACLVPIALLVVVFVCDYK